MASSMLRYILKRLLIMVPLVFVALVLTFILTQMMTGDPTSILPLNTPVDIRNAFIQKWGLDKPWYVQFSIFFKSLLRGDMGVSSAVAPNTPVLEYLKLIIPRTLGIGFIPMFVVPVIGIKMSIFSAKNRNKIQDNVLRGLSMFFSALPAFLSAMFLQLFFGKILPDFTNDRFSLPIFGIKSPGLDDPYFTGFRFIDCILAERPDLAIDTLKHLIQPIIVLTMLSFAGILRFSRSSLLDVLEKDYIRTARAKGCSEKTIYNKHALRNSLITTTEVIANNTVSLLIGGFLVELVYNIPAMGGALVHSILWRDYWMTIGIVFFTSIIIIGMHIIVDVLYTILDPRIRFK